MSVPIEPKTGMKIVVLPPSAVIITTFWGALHKVILEAYKPTRKEWPLPTGFERLGSYSGTARMDLLAELGHDAQIAIAFDPANGQGLSKPIACAAIQKFKKITQKDIDESMKKQSSSDDGYVVYDGRLWLDEEGEPHLMPDTSEPVLDEYGKQIWELNLVTTAADYRNRKISRQLIWELAQWVKDKHAACTLMVRTVDEISGSYWREKLGFETVEEMCLVLPKGFSHVKAARDDQKLGREVALWAGRREVRELLAEMF